MADQTNPRFMTQEEATGGASGLAAWEKRVGALSSPANNSPVVPPAGGTGGALPASSYTDSGTMASFLGSMTDTTNANLKSLQNIGQQLPQLGENDVMIRAQADKNKAGITSMYDSTRELVDIQSQQGNQQLARFGEMLSAPDYQIKNKIQEYGNQVQVFHKQVNATLERLTTDEQNALDQQDMNAYNQIRTEKNDWINMQRGMIQDQTNLMNNAFSQLMTGMSFQRQQTIDTKNNASNQLSYFQSAYGGKPFDSMAPQDQKTVIDSAAVLGISPDMVKNMMQTPQAAHYISKPGAIYVLDRSGNILRTITTPGDNSSAGTTGTEAATYFKNYGGTLSGGTASATAEARRQVNNFAKTAVGSQVMVARNKAI